MLKLASAIVTMFGSAYVREQLFSPMNFVKSTVRNHLGSDTSAACMQFKTTCYKPRIDTSAIKMQQQISH